MTLAIAAAIIECNDNFENLEANAIKWMQRIGNIYPNYGYGGNFRHWLKSNNPQPYNSWGNGSAMRVSPCAYASDNLEEVLALSDSVTKVTHNHEEGIKGARATTEAIFLARTGVGKKEIGKALEKYYDLNFTLNDIREDYEFDVSCQGSVPQAIKAFLESNDFEDAIRNAISIGGDSDTIAAITGSIAEAYYGVPDNIRVQIEKKLDETQKNILVKFEEKYKSKVEIIDIQKTRVRVRKWQKRKHKQI